MKKSSQESSREFISIGLMLFALFFGAGNLIFPVFLGQNAGWNTPWATIGFLITGVGLPFAAVLAICYSGAGLKELASRVHPVYGVLFSSLLYLTIGPFFAIPRTATVSFEIAAAPFLTDAQKTIGLYVFVFILPSVLVAGCHSFQACSAYRQGHHADAASFPLHSDRFFYPLPDGTMDGTFRCLFGSVEGFHECTG